MLINEEQHAMNKHSNCCEDLNIGTGNEGADEGADEGANALMLHEGVDGYDARFTPTGE